MLADDGETCILQIVEEFFELATDLVPPTPSVELTTGSASLPDVSGLVKNSRTDKYQIYIGRPQGKSKPKSGHPKVGWGNPFRMGSSSRGAVIREYTEWIMKPEQAALRAEARTLLKGKTLGCFCKPLPCHGDVLAVVANSANDAELDKLCS